MPGMVYVQTELKGIKGQRATGHARGGQGEGKEGKKGIFRKRGARADINPAQPAKVIIRRLSGSDSSFRQRASRLDFSR